MVDENNVNESHPKPGDIDIANPQETGSPKPDDKGDEEANQITNKLDNYTPISKSKEATKNFWELIVEATNNMNWKLEELNRRSAQGLLFKNNKYKTAKYLLITHSDIDVSYPLIRDPEGITDQDRLNFMLNIWTKVKSTSKGLNKLAKPDSFIPKSPRVMSMFKHLNK